MYKMPYRRDVFCIEGHWSSDLRDKATVKHSLELLKDLRVVRQHFHERCRNRDDLFTLLRTWSQRSYAAYSVGYLAFHGDPGGLYLNGHTFVKLDEIADALGGRACGKLLHVGCCGTVDVDRRHLTRFLRTSGCEMICGYTETVDWVDSAAFEIMLFRDLQMRKTPRGIDSYLRNHREAWALARRLGFRMVYLRPDEK